MANENSCREVYLMGIVMLYFVICAHFSEYGTNHGTALYQSHGNNILPLSCQQPLQEPAYKIRGARPYVVVSKLRWIKTEGNTDNVEYVRWMGQAGTHGGRPWRSNLNAVVMNVHFVSKNGSWITRSTMVRSCFNKDILAWLLIEWRQCWQPIRSHGLTFF